MNCKFKSYIASWPFNNPILKYASFVNHRATRIAVAVEGQAVEVVYPYATGRCIGMDVGTYDAVTPLGRDGPEREL